MRPTFECYKEQDVIVRFAALVAAIAFAVPALAAQSYTIDPDHTYPGFEVNHLGFSNMRGTFTSCRGLVVLDPEKTAGSIEITIDTGSVFTGHAKRDQHLRGEDFFNVARYPTMTFTATKLGFKQGELTAAEGELTLLGKTRPVILTITNFSCGPNPISKKATCGANAIGTIRRSEFGMVAYVPAVSDEVRLYIEVEAYRE